MIKEEKNRSQSSLEISVTVIIVHRKAMSH